MNPFFLIFNFTVWHLPSTCFHEHTSTRAWRTFCSGTLEKCIQGQNWTTGLLAVLLSWRVKKKKGQLLYLFVDHEATLLPSAGHGPPYTHKDTHTHTHTLLDTCAHTLCPWGRIGLLFERCIIRTGLTWSAVHSWAGHTQTQPFPSAASLTGLLFYMLNTHAHNTDACVLSLPRIQTHTCTSVSYTEPRQQSPCGEN